MILHPSISLKTLWVPALMGIAMSPLVRAQNVAVADAVSLLPGQKVRIDVLANDIGNFDASTVQVVVPPTRGSVAVDPAGRILYTHSGGGPNSDAFTYRASGPGGMSNGAAVTISLTTQRIANPAINVPATPPATDYGVGAAFDSLAFDQPVCLASPPGETKRLFVCEKTGLLRVIPDVTLASPTAATFLDLPALLSDRGESLLSRSEQGLLGVAFHPNYATNRKFFIFYSVLKDGSAYERVSRFTTQNGAPEAADPTSEVVLLEQIDREGNHNGGDLHFGPDGYLYISVGDEGAAYDPYHNSQMITRDFFSGILRIDVDKKAGSLAPNAHDAVLRDSGVARFAVPPDNPFVGATSFNGESIPVADRPMIRTEFWAVGLRNPWRFSFDDETGELWCGDVGQDSWEEVNVITRGGNYGWATFEGDKEWSTPPAGMVHTLPLYEYGHPAWFDHPGYEGFSMTGGLVYRGTRISALTGAYLFADYGSGHLWSLRRNPTGPPTVQRIAGPGAIVAFGTDPSNQDVLLANINTGRILRLTATAAGGGYPATLGETGLFADLSTLAPSPGVVGYDVNLTFWSDHALKRRWFVVPDGTGKFGWSRDGSWSSPAGAVWVKHFDIETTRGNPATKRRLETRLMVKTGTGAYGVSYRWNDAQTDATLVPDEGDESVLSIIDNGTPRTQRWRFPSRAECMMCHLPQSGYALSFNTRQLNRAGTVHGAAGPQLDLLASYGYFSNSPEAANVLPRHLRSDEVAFPVEARVRSYLDVNCSYCHRAGVTAGGAAWDGRAQLTLDQTGLLNGALGNVGGDPLNRLVVPGDTAHSVVLSRIAATHGFSRMPPLASTVLDASAVALLTDWIGGALPGRQSYSQWRLARFGSLTSPPGAPAVDADNDGRTNHDEFVEGTHPLSGSNFITLSPVVAGSTVTVSFAVPANRSWQVMTSRDLGSWAPWEVPGNQGLPAAGGPVSLSGPAPAVRTFFRATIWEN